MSQLNHPSGHGFPTDPPASLLEEFVSVIAHALQTPIAIVYSATETILEHGDDTPRLHALLQVIKRNALLASLMLRRLGVARDIEAGTVDLTLERCRPRPLHLPWAGTLARRRHHGAGRSRRRQ